MLDTSRQVYCKWISFNESVNWLKIVLKFFPLTDGMGFATRFGSSSRMSSSVHSSRTTGISTIPKYNSKLTALAPNSGKCVLLTEKSTSNLSSFVDSNLCLVLSLSPFWYQWFEVVECFIDCKKFILIESADCKNFEKHVFYLLLHKSEHETL